MWILLITIIFCFQILPHTYLATYSLTSNIPICFAKICQIVVSKSYFNKGSPFFCSFFPFFFELEILLICKFAKSVRCNKHSRSILLIYYIVVQFYVYVLKYKVIRPGRPQTRQTYMINILIIIMQELLLQYAVYIQYI